MKEWINASRTHQNFTHKHKDDFKFQFYKKVEIKFLAYVFVGIKLKRIG